MRTGILLFFAGLLLAVGLSGCGGGGNGSNLPDPLIRFVNASPDSNPLDFFINADKKGAAVDYLTSSTEVSTTKGDRDISVQDSTNQLELDALGFTFALDQKYVSMTAGLENFGTESEKRLRLIAFQYDKNGPNGSKARLLIEHTFTRAAGFNTPNIDFQGGLVATYDPNNPQYKVADVAFAANQPSELEVDAGVSTIFQVRRAGTENVYASSTDTFDSGGIYLAIFTGIEDGVGAQAPQIKYIKLN